METEQKRCRVDADLKTYLDAMRHEFRHDNEETRKVAWQLNQETRKLAQQLNQETRELAQQLNQETRILIEAVQHDVRGVADGFIQLDRKIDRIFDDHESRIARLEGRMP